MLSSLHLIYSLSLRSLADEVENVDVNARSMKNFK